MPTPPTGTVTLLFTDIEGSTQLLQRLGDRYLDVLATHQQLMRAAFQAWEGYEVNTEGDSFFVAFRRAGDAVAAAIAAQQALAAHPWPKDAAVRLRMGIHTGEPACIGNDYVGLDVHRAARLAAAGHGGQVLLSRTTRDLVEHELADGVVLRDLGACRLKDLLRPEHLFQLVIAGLPDTFPPLKTLDARPTNLPVQATALIGREREIATVRDLLRRADVRLLTLTGPGGTGKTRLALQTAAELLDTFADGVFFSALASVHDPELVASTIAQAFGIWELGSTSVIARLKDYLHAKQLLLVLDNFEQVLGAAPLVGELLAAAPRLKVLVTSRAVLRLYGEREFAVPPLSLPDVQQQLPLERLTQYNAVRLFIERAQAVKADFTVTNANAPAVAEICVRLDGLPLAIELAAKRIKLFAPQALLARLSNRLKLLVGGAQNLPARQQTLRGTIDWSYNLLSPDEQALFRRLGVFVGGCTLEAAEVVCRLQGTGNREQEIAAEEQASLSPIPYPVSPIDGLAALVDNSLLRQEERMGGEPRFMMLETIREYALDRLEEHGELAALEQRYDAYYLALAEAADLGLQSPDHEAWLKQLEGEYDNLRATLQHSLAPTDSTPTALQFAKAIWRFWSIRGYINEGRAWLADGLMARIAADPALLRATLLHGAEMLIMTQPEGGQATTLVSDILALRKSLGDTLGVAEMFGVLGIVAVEQGYVERGKLLTEESLAIARELGHPDVIVRALNNLGVIERGLGHYTRAVTLLEEGLALCHDLGDTTAAGRVLGNLGIVVRAVAQYDRAAGYLAESVRLSHESGDTINVLWNLHHIAMVMALQGQLVGAVHLLAAIDDQYKAIGVPRPRDEDQSYVVLLADVRSRMGDEAFSTAWAAGQAISFEAAIAAAQERHIKVGQPSDAGEPIRTLAEPAFYPAGLTEREIEILRLVAQGMTDAQVAERLVISPRTVQGHLRSIYSKLDVTSRTGATRFAIEHQLV